MVFVRGYKRSTGREGVKKLTRTQKEIIAAMHMLRYPATVNDIADKAGMSWVTVKVNLKFLKKHGLVIEEAEEGERTYWSVNYDVFRSI